MRKVLVSSMIGNALEWYDFILYVQFAKIIGNLYFPGDDEYMGLLKTFGIFAIGFFMRPLGGILFGYFGDKYGRKMSLVVSILLMAIPTAMIGIIPTYAQIGIWAPILLTVIRLLQGLALGGGFSGCMTFLVEHAPKDKRGIIGSASMSSLGIGVLIGIIVSTSISMIMDEASFNEWGWRIPFIASLFVGMVAFYIRSYVQESPVYLKAKEHGKLTNTPVMEVIRNHKKELLTASGVYLTVCIPFYTFTAYFNNYMHNTLGYSMHDTLVMNGIAMTVFIIFVAIGGLWSDKIGRKPVLFYTAIVIAFISWPVFSFLGSGGYAYPLAAQIVFAIVLGLYIGPVPATLVEIFPTSIRFTGLALSYNISVAVFGGTVPMVYLWLINKTDSYLSPSYYIMLFVVATLWIIYDYKDKYNQELAE